MKSIWPILCKIHWDPDVLEPFTVAVCLGNSKPKDSTQILKQFIIELNELSETGIEVKSKKYL